MKGTWERNTWAFVFRETPWCFGEMALGLKASGPEFESQHLGKEPGIAGMCLKMLEEAAC